MNPITNMKNLNKMNDREIDMGVAGTSKSWHNEYKDSAWIFAGGLPYDLTEGDIVCVFSQYGEIVHINLVRDQKTGKSKGFTFICYEDQRSTILAVDNLNGMKLLGRLVRVDHVHTYRLPKDLEKMDADRRKLFLEGCAPKPLENKVSEGEQSDELLPLDEKETFKKKKKKKDKKKKSKKKKYSSSNDSSSSDSESDHKRTNSKKSKSDRRSRTPDRKRSKNDHRDRKRQSSTDTESDHDRRSRSLDQKRSKKDDHSNRFRDDYRDRKRDRSRDRDRGRSDYKRPRSRDRDRDSRSHRRRSPS